MDTPLDMQSLIGTLVAGRYRLERHLDEGAFGAVFRAVHLAYGVELREVALKVAKRPMTDSEARRVFGDALLMAKLAGEANDPLLRQHFVTVYDAGRCEDGSPLAGRPYLVMELIRGGSVAGCLEAGPFPLKRAREYFEQVLTAMAFMHSRSLAHRDLKPANLLVSRADDARDVVKVTDFGLAVAVDSLLGWVESGGDLAYLAPESFSHDICSPQSDVYMLGLVFYEMVAGVNPFHDVGRKVSGADADQQAELRRLHLTARQQERFPVLERHEELRQCPALTQVIRNALVTDMNTRPYRDAVALQTAWRQALAGRTTSRVELAWERVRRLTGEAEQFFAVGDVTGGEVLLREAGRLNQDRSQVPDAMVVGKTYLLQVERLLARGATEEAGRLAMEGYQRRPCRCTNLAAAHYYRSQQSVLADGFQREARECRDQS